MFIFGGLAPTFIKKPAIKQEDDGNRLLLECRIQSDPEPTITWTHNGKPVVAKGRFKDSGPTHWPTAPLAWTFVALTRKQRHLATEIGLGLPHPLSRECNRPAACPMDSPSTHRPISGVKRSWRAGAELTVQKKEGNFYNVALIIDDVQNEDGGKYQVLAKNVHGDGAGTITLNFDEEEEDEDEGKPAFIGKPLIKPSPDFTKVTFECKLEADPKPTIQWFHNGKPVKDSARQKYGLAVQKDKSYLVTLDIQNLSSEDGGTYKALAKNSAGESTATINLNLEGAEKPKIPGGKEPKFLKKPTIRQENENLLIEVNIEANPKPKISWFLGTAEVKEGPRHKMTMKDSGKDTYIASLEIIVSCDWDCVLQDPSTADGGTYKCTAHNECGTSSANIALNLQGEPEDEGPTFTKKASIIQKEGGKLIVMECGVKSADPPTATWFHGTTVVKESAKSKMKITKVKDEYIITLEIRDPKGPDGGAYKCVIKNKKGEISANLNLKLEDAGDEGAPTFVEKPKIVPLDGGKRVLMECRVKAKPKPDVSWTCEGQDIKPSARVVQTIKEDKPPGVYHITLELKEPDMSDAGVYRCSCKNAAGESNANLTLNIELAPAIREKPRVVTVERTKRIVVECRVQSLSKPKVEWSRDGKTVREDAAHIVKVDKVKDGEFAVQLEMPKPTPADKGTYLLTARNDKGVVKSQTVVVNPEGNPAPTLSVPTPTSNLCVFPLTLAVCGNIYYGKVDKKETKVDKKETKVDKKETKVDKKETKVDKKETKSRQEGDKIDSKYTRRTFEAGKTAEITAKIQTTSVQKTSVTWFRERRVIKETKTIKSKFDGTIASLTISEITTEMSGTYTCEVVNEFGSEESSAVITVKACYSRSQTSSYMCYSQINLNGFLTRYYHFHGLCAESKKKKEEEEEEKKDAKPKLKKTKDEAKDEKGKPKLKKPAPKQEEEVDFSKIKLKKTPQKEEDGELSSPGDSKPASRKGSTDSKPSSRKGSTKPEVLIPSVPTVKEPTPEPQRSDSIDSGSRKSSMVGSRRCSIVVADEKGVAVDDSGMTKRLRPGEMLEVRKRRGSDVRRTSMSELQEKVDKPSTPLRPIPEIEDFAPSIVDYQENIMATAELGYFKPTKYSLATFKIEY
ncbi:unc-22 [Cordylochernes scorpioides]|uniref:Unc-22 n=1 Tax=Cordylochernes scorpioides TaxID=51811 RepID=A0ABY6LE46_9ARAC|nr:unc-22 [Cordylochernes scorpioides]